jgi:Xaa-Pro aminopeptidase
MRLDPARRRVRLDGLRAALQDAGLPALVVSNPLNIAYLTGFRGSAGSLVVFRDRAELLVDFRYVTAARDAVGGDADIVVILAPSDIDAAIAERLAADGPPRVGIEAEWVTVARMGRMEDRVNARAGGLRPVLVAAGPLVEQLRMIKDDDEIATLREAGRRLARVARQVEAMPRVGRREDEVAGAVDAAMKAAGFSGPAFETIVASGPNGALPHARPTARVMQPGDGVVLDFGGVYGGYCVDLTRTVQLPPETSRFRELRSAVRVAQQAAIVAVRPGAAASDVDAAARESLSAVGLGEAFGHATGHGIGLEVHEAPRIARAAEGRPAVVLAAGMIFTVEPGAYLEGYGGVRIEDDVLVTRDGCEVLTSDG